MKYFNNFLIILSMMSFGEGYHILAIFPFIGKSHQIFNFAIAKSLVEAGHEVTVIASYSLVENPPSNFHFIKFNSTLTQFKGLHFFSLNSITYFEMMNIIWSYSDELCDDFLAEPGIKSFMNSSQKFDALLLENFSTECYMGFAHTLNIPIIQTVSYIGSQWITDSVGAPFPYSYVHEPFMFLNHQMGFLDRFKNTVSGLIISFLRYWRYLPKIDKLMRKHFQDPNMPSIAELESTRTSLLLINNHESFSYAKPGMPNMVNVAGVHIQPNKPLPSHLQKFMDEAEDGFIFVGMGSSIPMKQMDSQKRDALIKVLNQIKPRVILRWDVDYPIPKDSKNILFSPWLPQSDILAHPNILFFVTHGGLLSTIEAIDKGVPVIGFPIFADQLLNIRRYQSKGLGIVIEYHNISEASLEWAFQEISKSRYRETAKNYSKIFHDRENDPKNSTVWWVEYIIRHQGAKHLRSHGLDLYWFQYYLLDILCAITLPFIFLYNITKFIFNYAFRYNQSQVKIKYKNN